MIALYLILAIVGLLAVWLPVMLVATLFSGWWELSRSYPYTPPEPSDDGSHAKRLQGSVYFSPLFRYQRFVHAAVDSDYLHLSMPPIAGAFHKPMSIPWVEISSDAMAEGCSLDQSTRAGMQSSAARATEPQPRAL